jgi:hypothetical protein
MLEIDAGVMVKGPTKKPPKDKTILIRMRVSPILYAYLGLLSRKTIIGASENDVAEYVLTKQLEKMIAEKYHETHAPPTDALTSANNPSTSEKPDA